MKLIKECEKSNTSVIIASKQKNVKNENYDFYLGEYLSTTDENKKINDDPSLELSKIRPYGKWFDTYFPNVDIQYITYSGIIAISKKHIQQHPINYYKMLIDQLSNSSNPEVGHYFERSWVAVFHPMTDAKFIES